jgi:phage terminase large subunit
MNLEIATPRWAVPLLKPARYKAVKGGRGSGKSHFFAELLVEEHVANPDQKSVCIREIQKSLQFSARELIKGKISSLGVSHLFEITQTEIRSKNGNGIIIFQGMQDHTSDSIKSLEGFDRAWVEEAQSLSARSIQLLRPTIRNENSEIWFSWNPDQPTDPIDQFFCGEKGLPDNAILVHVNYCDNPFLPKTLREEMEFDRKYNPDSFGHVWLGEYNKKADAQIFFNKWMVDEFEPTEDWGSPYFGLDFGFSTDPTAAVKCWIHDRNLYIEYEGGRVGLELDDTADYLNRKIPDICANVVRADSARPESISYLKRPDPRKERKHIPKIEPVKKWAGSVEDGIMFIKSFKKIIIHTRCTEMQKEARLYNYKIDRNGDILPEIVDKHNHYWDAVRYALGGMIKGKTKGFFS